MIRSILLSGVLLASTGCADFVITSTYDPYYCPPTEVVIIQRPRPVYIEVEREEHHRWHRQIEYACPAPRRDYPIAKAEHRSPPVMMPINRAAEKRPVVAIDDGHRKARSHGDREK